MFNRVLLAARQKIQTGVKSILVSPKTNDRKEHVHLWQGYRKVFSARDWRLEIYHQFISIPHDSYIYMDISGINPSYNYKPRQLTIGHRLERGLAEARVTMYCNSKLKGSVSSIQLRSFVYDLYGTLW